MSHSYWRSTPRRPDGGPTGRCNPLRNITAAPCPPALLMTILRAQHLAPTVALRAKLSRYVPALQHNQQVVSESVVVARHRVGAGCGQLKKGSIRARLIDRAQLDLR